MLAPGEGEQAVCVLKGAMPHNSEADMQTSAQSKQIFTFNLKTVESRLRPKPCTLGTEQTESGMCKEG